jgi:hypothetical protein
LIFCLHTNLNVSNCFKKISKSIFILIFLCLIFQLRNQFLSFEIYKSKFLNLNNSFKTSRSVNLTQKYSCLLLRIIFAKSFVLLELLVKISTFSSRFKVDFEILFLHVYDSKTGMKCCNLLIRNGLNVT